MTTDLLAQAFSQHYNQFQRLTFLLEAKGIISADELAAIYDEQQNKPAATA
jgi:hypothetical protein